jgi:hypothetical protein
VELVREEMSGLGLDPAGLDVREVRDEADAAREGFVGSPTVRVDGADVEASRDARPALTCRVYRLRDGRVSALPDRADVTAALANAIEGGETEDERG